MKTQGTFDFPDHVQGTTLKARDFVIEGVETDLVSADIVFEKDGVTTIPATLTITSTAPPWAFTMEAVDASDTEVEEGIHTYAVRTIDENGEGGTEKYIAGTINILPSPTFAAP
jgi:hypothetical protein